MGGIGLVAGQDEVDRLACGLKGGIIKVALRIGGGEAGCEQHRIALPQGDGHPLCQTKHHLPAGPRSSRLQEAEVARRDLRVESEGELAETASLSPLS